MHIAKRLKWPDSAGWHSHWPVQWIAAGASMATFETEAGLWAILPGQAVMVASNVPHDLRWYGAETLATVYMELDAILFAPGQACRIGAVSPLLGAAVDALIDEPWPYGEHSRATVLVPLILDEMRRNERPLFGLPTPDSQTLRTLCRQLRDNPADLRDLDAWAGTIGTSRRTLTRRFRDETGLSFVEWRQRAKVMFAARRSAEQAPAKQAAKDAGYASVQAMRAETRRLIGA